MKTDNSSLLSLSVNSRQMSPERGHRGWQFRPGFKEDGIANPSYRVVNLNMRRSGHSASRDSAGRGGGGGRTMTGADKPKQRRRTDDGGQAAHLSALD